MRMFLSMWFSLRQMKISHLLQTYDVQVTLFFEGNFNLNQGQWTLYTVNLCICNVGTLILFNWEVQCKRWKAEGQGCAEKIQQPSFMGANPCRTHLCPVWHWTPQQELEGVCPLLGTAQPAREGWWRSGATLGYLLFLKFLRSSSSGHIAAAFPFFPLFLTCSRDTIAKL